METQVEVFEDTTMNAEVDVGAHDEDRMRITPCPSPLLAVNTLIPKTHFVCPHNFVDRS
jgi:hypothetical protein